MHKHFLPVTALALAMGCRCAQALAAENTGQRLAGSTKGLRLTVRQIYADAGEDRDLAISLLRRYGYLL